MIKMSNPVLFTMLDTNSNHIILGALCAVIKKCSLKLLSKSKLTAEILTVIPLLMVCVDEGMGAVQSVREGLNNKNRYVVRNTK